MAPGEGRLAVGVERHGRDCAGVFLENGQFPAWRGGPDPRHVPPANPGGDALAVGAESCASTLAYDPLEDGHHQARLDVPQPHLAIRPPGEGALAVGAERDAID